MPVGKRPPERLRQIWRENIEHDLQSVEKMTKWELSARNKKAWKAVTQEVKTLPVLYGHRKVHVDKMASNIWLKQGILHGATEGLVIAIQPNILLGIYKF